MNEYVNRGATFRNYNKPMGHWINNLAACIWKRVILRVDATIRGN